MTNAQKHRLDLYQRTWDDLSAYLMPPDYRGGLLLVVGTHEAGGGGPVPVMERVYTDGMTLPVRDTLNQQHFLEDARAQGILVCGQEA